MALYFLRHGESEANLVGLFAGQGEDSALTQLGIAQAQKAGKALHGLGIQIIISSKLQRAYQTASEVARIIGVDDISFDDRILEYDMGELTGTPNREVTSLELISAIGAEDTTAFQDRVLSFLREYKNRPENILFVSHAGVARIIEATKQGIDPTLFYDLPSYPNARAIRLDLDWLTEPVLR